MATVQEKLKYLINTKDIIKRKIQYFVIMPDWTPFRKYADYIGLIGTNYTGHDTSFKYIPAPRIRTAHTVELPDITHKVITLHHPAFRITTGRLLILPPITHETEVQKLG